LNDILYKHSFELNDSSGHAIVELDIVGQHNLSKKEAVKQILTRGINWLYSKLIMLISTKLCIL